MPELSKKAGEALKLFEEGCVQHHRGFLTRLRERYRAYHGILDQRSDAASWESKLAPKFVNHIVDSSLAAIVDGKLSYRVKPAARFYDPGEYERVLLGARAHQILHASQLRADRFHETQQPFALQDAIAGITVAKTFWRRDVRMRPRLKVVPDERALELGVTLPRLVETEELDVCYDGPTTEVVNVEDFYWHEAATDLQSSPVIGHVVWMSFSDLERLEAAGQYQNVPSSRTSVTSPAPTTAAGSPTAAPAPRTWSRSSRSGGRNPTASTAARSATARSSSPRRRRIRSGTASTPSPSAPPGPTCSRSRARARSR
jgi:hypothetical protein